MQLENLRELEFVGYPNHRGGRVWIGNVPVANVYERGGNPTLFNEDPITFDFEIGQWLKFQPNDSWLEAADITERQKNCRTIEEGLEWVKSKLYEEGNNSTKNLNHD